MLIQTTAALVPTVPCRLVLKETVPLKKHRLLRADLANAIAVEVERARFDFGEKSA